MARSGCYTAGKTFKLDKVYYLNLVDKLDGINFVPIFFTKSIIDLVKSDGTHSTFAGWFGRLLTLVPIRELPFIIHSTVLMP